MSFAPVELLTVYFDADGERRKAGRLALRDRRILFEYDPAFVAGGIEISPVKLPLRSGVFVNGDGLFEGLFGVFNDSLPDGWGRLLIDRIVEKQGLPRGQMSPLDRLTFSGSGGMGALSYAPDRGEQGAHAGELALDALARDVALVLEGDGEDRLEELVRLSGSSAGARPKVMVQTSRGRRSLLHGQSALRNGYEHWIIKFRSAHDPADMGAIEFAYSEMAGDAGVRMPETHLFAGKGRGYFGAKRFDRDHGRRVHMHSLAGLVHADFRMPSLDYDTILRVTSALTRDIREVEHAFVLACFNVLAHNRDDHANNFSFLLNGSNDWTFAPAYDLTFSAGPGGEHSTAVMGEGKAPGRAQLLELGKRHGLKTAPALFERVRESVAKWPAFAKKAGVTQRSARQITRIICR